MTLTDMTAEDRAHGTKLLESLRELRLDAHNTIAPQPLRRQPERQHVLLLCGRLSDPRQRAQAVETLQRIRRDHGDARLLCWAPPEFHQPQETAGVRSLAELLPTNTPLLDALELADLICAGDDWAAVWALLHGTQALLVHDSSALRLGTEGEGLHQLSAESFDLERLAYLTFERLCTWVDGTHTPTLERFERITHARSKACAREVLGLRPLPTSPVPAISFRVEETWRPSISRMLPEYDFTFFGWGEDKEWREVVHEFHGKHPNGVLVLWGFFQPKLLPKLAAKLGIPIYRFEDTFLRSVGIGAEPDAWGRPNEPMGICVDSRGMYYDYSRPSDIEVLLQSYPFDSDPILLRRATRTMERIRSEGLTKYNLTLRLDPESILPPRGAATERVLVLGQVETDKSILKGCANPVTNNDVVRLAARENPEAQILYKPHPVVLRGVKRKLSDPREVASLCHIISEEVNLPDLFGAVEKVYVITSGSGFEALLHGCQVTCMGSNFYTGWGLTDDRQETPRRARRLTLTEAFAGFYILHSRYYDHRRKQAVSLEGAIDALLVERESQRGVEVATRGFRDLERGLVESGIEALRHAVALNPTIDRWRAGLATGLEALGRSAEAHAEYAKLLERTRPEIEWYLGAARCAERLGETDQTVDAYLRQAEQRDSSQVAQLAGFAHAYQRGADWEPLLLRAVATVRRQPGNVPFTLAYPVLNALLEIGCPLQARRLLCDVLAEREPSEDAPVPLRLRPLAPTGDFPGSRETWATSLLRRLEDALGACPDAWKGQRIKVEGHANENATLCHVVGTDALPRGSAIQLLSDAPGPACAGTVVVDELLLERPVTGWRALADSLRPDTEIVVIPKSHHRWLRRKFGRRPSDLLLLGAWLARSGTAQLELSALQGDLAGHGLEPDELTWLRNAP